MNKQLLLGGSALLTLVFAASNAGAAVSGSKHDLSFGSGNNAFSAANTTVLNGQDQVCVFCHTPHGAQASQAIPLWNHETTASVFTLYQDVGTGTLDGQFADDGGNGQNIGGVSLACLSCHDGTVALASVANAPGSGDTATTNWGNGTWINGGSTLNNGTGAAATLGGTAGLDADLSNDHPVAIQYAGGGYTISAGAIAGTAKDPFFKGPVISAGGTQAFVDVTGDGKTADDLPLYTNHLTATPAVNEPFVECASCHDPHDSTGNAMFLRASADNSAICTACHIK